MNQDHNARSTRRTFLTTSGAAASAAALTAAASASALQPQPSLALPAAGKFPIRVISSGNGQRATRRAYQMILDGQDTLKACVAGVNIVEDDPLDTSVGYGGLPNEHGVVQLDAAVMHGPTHLAGAVASIERIRHPSSVAYLVMEQTDHVLLVGQGALDFARAQGFPEENLLTERARKIWLRWRQSLSPDDDWLEAPHKDPLDQHAAAIIRQRPTGTIHCAGMNAAGDISCVTTTSGLAFKIAGRVGDSPIIGAGLYVDNEIGSCGSTGRGEANLQNQCSFAAVELMRGGMDPQDAGLEVLRRVAKHTAPRLRNEKGEPDFGLMFYVLRKDGKYAGVSMRGGGKFSVTDEAGTRLENCISLYA